MGQLKESEPRGASPGTNPYHAKKHLIEFKPPRRKPGDKHNTAAKHQIKFKAPRRKPGVPSSPKGRTKVARGFSPS